ncbi:MAG: cryptochrome/photolyase family protein [Bacteroidota bacterium]
MAYSRVAIILGDHLFPNHSALNLGENTLVFMAEDYDLCTHFKYHKHKIILFLSAMRNHAQGLADTNKLVYHQLEEAKTISYEDKLANTLAQYPNISELVSYQIEDHFFAERITGFCNKKGLRYTEVESPSFLTTRQQFADYLGGVKKPFMATFYQRQRRRLDMLIDPNGAPLHGKWSFDEDNRKKLPKTIDIPNQPVFQDNEQVEAVKKLVDTLFSDHPGKTNDFWLATTREQALHCLDKFLRERFERFGPYEDAFEADQVWLFHSVLSPYINMGLLTAGEVVEQAISFAKENNVHYPSVEGFVRQIIGWREFIRGMYHHYEPDMRKNVLGHERKLTAAWYDGTTGVAPLDDVIKRVDKYGYAHHIERLMVIGNMMLLAEIDPEEVNRWFMELFVDSADWVMVPNVFGMSQFSGGGIFATKPYICGANYWSKMSRYSKKSDWVDIVDGLYWRFIDRKRELFLSNPRMSMMVRLLNKMAGEKRERIFDRAEAWLEEFTS